MGETEMKIVAFAVQGETSNWEIIMPSGARLALQFDLEVEGTDAVHDFINVMSPQIEAHLQMQEWIPSSDGFEPDRKEREK